MFAVTYKASKRGTLEPGDSRHGTSNGYIMYGCRCDLCRAAAATQRREHRARQRGTLEPDDPRHGSINAYTNYGCRCDPCRDIASTTQKQTRSNR